MAAINLVSRAPAPTSVYIARGHRGPPTMVWLGAPDQGASQAPVRPVGLERERDQPNILPLDLNFTFNLILSSLFVSSHIGT